MPTADETGPERLSQDELYEQLFPPEEERRLRNTLVELNQAQLHFALDQVRHRREGRPAWTLEGEVALEDWERRDQEEWWRLTYEGLPGVQILLRLAPTDRGLACTGLLIEHLDGREVTARELRQIQLRPLLDGALAAYNQPLRELHRGELAVPSRPGPAGHDEEHWQRVHRRYIYWRDRDPRRVVKRMREDYPAKERPSDATMRRWVKTVRERIEGGSLP